MQYILSEEEYSELKKKQSVQIKADKGRLMEVCRLAADHIPILEKGFINRPWGCILSDTATYCDKCPVKDVCPNDYKRWSK
jgi:hypothetical protein